MERDVAEGALDALIHVKPPARRVYELACSHGFDACIARYPWMDPTQVGRLISQGRAQATGAPAPSARRTLTLEQQREVVAAVHELGGVSYAARAYGIGEYLVRTIVHEQGGEYPRVSRRPADVAAAAQRIEAFRARRTA